MAFETFPIPDKGAKLDEVISRIGAQHDLIVPVITSLYQGMNGSIQNQGAALAKIVNKLTRATNGRIKQQGAMTNGVVGKIYSAMDGSIAEQGQQLALQSALLSRLAPQPAAQLSHPQAPGGSSAFSAPFALGAGQSPIGTTVPSLPAGALSPPLIPQPQSPPPPISQTSLQSAGGLRWACLVDCDARTMDAYDLSKWQTRKMVREGAFVPIRYAEDYAFIKGNWLNEIQGWEFLGNLPYRGQWIDIACHARETNGEGWPANGDFPHEVSTTVAQGYPVGDWPFDKSGHYIGL